MPKKFRERHSTWLYKSEARQKQIAAVNTPLNGLLEAQWGDRTLDIMTADTRAALCNRRMIHKHSQKECK